MRALVTGGAGFVGRHLHAHLAAFGDEITVLDRRAGDPDITDRKALIASISATEPEVIYHLAAQAHVPTAWQDPISTIRSNVEGTLNVLDAADRAGVRRVVIASSADVYGSADPDSQPISESTEVRPNNPYAASKLAAEALAIQSLHGRGQEVVRLRPFNHFGPGQDTRFVCAGFAHRIALAEQGGETDIAVGRLDVRRDFSDVRDVVRAYRLAALAGRPGAVYNVCSGTDRAIEEIAYGLAERAKAEVRFVEDQELLRPVDTPVLQGSSAALTADTGWTPQIPFATTLTDVLEDARNRVGNG